MSKDVIAPRAIKKVTTPNNKGAKHASNSSKTKGPLVNTPYLG